MKPDLTEWDQDLLPDDPEEEYQALVRALQRTQGFGLIFVRCADTQETPLIDRVKADLPQKTIDVLTLTEPIDDFYNRIKDLPNREQLNVLFVRGLKYSLYDYEETKRLLSDWSSEDILTYSWKGVPKILTHLNQQRDRFRDDFNICFVFLLPSFAVKYLVNRAPDFFDWRSGLFEIPTDAGLVGQESLRVLLEGDYAKYCQLTPEERHQRLLEIQELLEEQYQTAECKAQLLFERGNLFHAAQGYKVAIASYDRALEIQPDIHQAWYNRGVSLLNLGRYEAAIASYDRALELQPDIHQAWYNRGVSLLNLGRYEEAIASYDRAVGINPDFQNAWHGRGVVLGKLGRYEEAIASYDRAVEIKPDNQDAWYGRGMVLGNLDRYEEAIASYDRAVEIKSDYYPAWNNRGLSLANLGRYEEAIASYERAVEIKPDYQDAWYNKACCLSLQGQVKEAIDNLQRTIELNPDKYRELAKNDSDFDGIRGEQRFQRLLEG